MVNKTLGQSSATDNRSNWDIHKQAYFTQLDSVVGEMAARFEGSNLDLLQSVEALLPSSKVFMQLEAVRPLDDLLQLQSDALAAEVSVGANFLLKKLAPDSSLDTATKEMLQFKNAFPNMYTHCMQLL